MHHLETGDRFVEMQCVMTDGEAQIEDNVAAVVSGAAVLAVETDQQVAPIPGGDSFVDLLPRVCVKRLRGPRWDRIPTQTHSGGVGPVDKIVGRECYDDPLAGILDRMGDGTVHRRRTRQQQEAPRNPAGVEAVVKYECGNGNKKRTRCWRPPSPFSREMFVLPVVSRFLSIIIPNFFIYFKALTN